MKQKNLKELKPLVMAFKIGQQSVLDRIVMLSKPWIQGKSTNEEFARELNELVNNYDEYKNGLPTNED